MSKKKNKHVQEQEKSEQENKAKTREFFLWVGVLVGIAIIIGGIIKLDDWLGDDDTDNTSSADVNNSVDDDDSFESIFSDYAEQIGLDVDQFKEDYNSDEIKSNVQFDLNQAQETLEINSTPTFFVNGEKYQPESEQEFKNKIQALVDQGGGDYQDYEGHDVVYKVTEDDWVEGDEEAKVIIMEYSNYTCPACSSWYPKVNSFVKEFDGQVKVVFRHFPFHDGAEESAWAAEAAGMQGKFWEMSDKLFETQSEW